MTLKDLVLSKADARQVVQELFENWTPGANMPCPKAAEKHPSGRDSNPSFAVSAEGKAFCHTCGTKASSVIGLVEEVQGVSFQEACVELYDRFVEPLVPEKLIKEWRDRLQKNHLVLVRLQEARGIGDKTIQKYELGWDGFRLTVPVRNEYGLCVNARRYDLLKRVPGAPKVISYKDKNRLDEKGEPIKFGKARIWPQSSFKGSGPLYLLEGEMDTLLALDRGLRAATVTIGAATWKPEWSKEFKGQEVVVIPDLDPLGKDGKRVGIEGAKARAKAIAAYAKSVGVVTLPVKGTKDDKDFTDWIIKGKGRVADLPRITERQGGPQKNKGVGGTSAASEEEEIPSEDGDLGSDDLGAFEQRTHVEEVNLARGEAAFDYMARRGAFFRNQEGDMLFSPEKGKPFRVNEKSEVFLGYLSNNVSKLINSATASGKFVVRHVIGQATSRAKQARSAYWGFYGDGAIWLHAGGNKIVRATNGRLEVMRNAINDHQVLLEAPQHSRAWEPEPDAEMGKAIEMLWKNLAEPLPMSHANKYLTLCWFLGLFYKDFIRAKPLMRFMASTASGKSMASRLLSIAAYGEEVLQHSATTSAAIYSLAQKYPLLVLDNIEVQNMTQALNDFLLIAATGGGKAKRKNATDVETITEEANCLVLTNGIEPISKRELISRTVEIGLDIGRFGKKDFHESQVIDRLRSSRGYMLSGLLKALSRHATPRIKSGEAQRIAREFGGHSKNRFNEYLGVMAIMLDVVWAYRPSEKFETPHKMVAEWLRTQTAVTDEQDAGTNDVLYFLGELVDRRVEMADGRVAVTVDEATGVTQIVGTTRELLTDFRILAKAINAKCPWQNERHLGTRIVDADELLRKAGWIRTYKISSGRKINVFARKAG